MKVIFLKPAFYQMIMFCIGVIVGLLIARKKQNDIQSGTLYIDSSHGENVLMLTEFNRGPKDIAKLNRALFKVNTETDLTKKIYVNLNEETSQK